MTNAIYILLAMIVAAAALALFGEGVIRLFRRRLQHAAATIEYKYIFIPHAVSDSDERIRKAWKEIKQLGGNGWQLGTIQERKHGYACWLKRETVSPDTGIQ